MAFYYIVASPDGAADYGHSHKYTPADLPDTTDTSFTLAEALVAKDVVVNGPFTSLAEAIENGAVMTSKPVTFQVFRSATSVRTDISLSADNTLQITGINTTPHPFTDEDFKTRVDECIAAVNAVRATDGYTEAQVAAVWVDENDVHISAWNVSQVTNMEGLFNGATEFNQDISNWNVSAVTTMAGMFYGASSFNSDLSGWDVGRVTTMNSMFGGPPRSTATSAGKSTR